MTSFAIPRIQPATGRKSKAPATSSNLPVPPSVVDHASFRNWARSEDFPKQGRFAWLDGMIWMDLMVEQVFSHNTVKNEFIAALLRHVNKRRLGHLLSDGVLLSNKKVGLSTKPDVLFVSFESEKSGKVHFKEGAREGVIELEGAPDMTLEVVSDSSVTKDTVNLKSLYYQAGVQEYWLVDARRGQVAFSILKRGARGFVPTPSSTDHFIPSAVFGASVRLSSKLGPTKRPMYTVTIKK